MKKLMLLFAFAACALAGNAQIYVGGEVGAWRDWNKNQTEITLKPEVGYGLTDHWSIGLALGYEHNYLDGISLNGFNVNPYARYTFAKFGPVSVFADGEAGFGTYKVHGADSSSNMWEVGVKPGVAVTLTKNLSFVTHLGFLGYRDCDDAINDLVDTGFGFKFSGYDLTFGLYYNF